MRHCVTLTPRFTSHHLKLYNAARCRTLGKASCILEKLHNHAHSEFTTTAGELYNDETFRGYRCTTIDTPIPPTYTTNPYQISTGRTPNRRGELYDAIVTSSLPA